MAFRKGSRVIITSDNDNYKPFLNKVYKISAVYRNEDEHYGYDMGLFPMKLFELTDSKGNILPFCLYEHEVENITTKYH